jgi:hypothetical protein
MTPRRRMTPKMKVLRKHRKATADRSVAGGWRIWLPSKYYRSGSDAISGSCNSPTAAWADAARRLR